MANLTHNDQYKSFLAEVKGKIQQAQTKAVVAVNQHLLLLYWEIGSIVLQRQNKDGWGAKVVEQLSKDLKKSFPIMKGFSKRKPAVYEAVCRSLP